MNRSLIARAGVVALTGITLIGGAGTALAANSPDGTKSSDSANSSDVVRKGSCSGHSHWKLSASPQNGRIEVEGEVDTNHGGQTWKWKMLHNGHVSAHGTATTGARSGSFDVHRRMVNASGPDKIGWRAKNVKTGEVCRGNLTF